RLCGFRDLFTVSLSIRDKGIELHLQRVKPSLESQDLCGQLQCSLSLRSHASYITRSMADRNIVHNIVQKHSTNVAALVVMMLILLRILACLVWACTLHN
ncbi:MAG TPA: hypothetical protein VEU33_09055, partial [Archangium sp.]|nr:hypothetical protein [Archangium sp.]